MIGGDGLGWYNGWMKGEGKELGGARYDRGYRSSRLLKTGIVAGLDTGSSVGGVWSSIWGLRSLVRLRREEPRGMGYWYGVW